MDGCFSTRPQWRAASFDQLAHCDRIRQGCQSISRKHVITDEVLTERLNNPCLWLKRRCVAIVQLNLA